jgi:hypothetical protein
MSNRLFRHSAALGQRIQSVLDTVELAARPARYSNPDRLDQPWPAMSSSDAVHEWRPGQSQLNAEDFE